MKCILSYSRNKSTIADCDGVMLAHFSQMAKRGELKDDVLRKLILGDFKWKKTMSFEWKPNHHFLLRWFHFSANRWRCDTLIAKKKNNECRG